MRESLLQRPQSVREAAAPPRQKQERCARSAQSELDGGDSSRATAWQWMAAAAAVTFVFLAIWRERLADNGPRRVWGELTRLFESWAHWGNALTLWTLEHFGTFVLALAAIAVAVALSLVFPRRRGPIAGAWWLLAAIVAAAGQWALGKQSLTLGIAGYLGALCLAFLFGTRVRQGNAVPRPAEHWDALAILWLLIVATFSRLWALEELPRQFEGEMGLSMLAGASWEWTKNYLLEALTAVSIGCAHLFVQLGSFAVLGDSAFSLRASGVVMGLATVWHLFWLVRKHVGRAGALCAAILATCGAEQLWWSRSENTYFIAVCLAGVLTARLTAWLLVSPRVTPALLVAVWMGVTRLFYLAAVSLVALPVVVTVHCLLFERVRRVMFFRVFVCVLLGVALWSGSLSLAHRAIRGEWRWIHPALHGELVASSGLPWSERVMHSVTRVATNAVTIAGQWTIRAGFTQWYQRQTWPWPATTINVGMVILGVLGLAVALAHWKKPVAALFVGWWVVGTLPALLSIEPADRRMAAAFPAWYALAGYGWQQASSWFASHAPRLGAVLWQVISWAVVVAIALCSAASHLVMPKREIGVAAMGRATRETFVRSEALYYEMDGAAVPLVILPHASQWRQRQQCVQSLTPSNWLTAIVERPCAFQDPVWTLLVSEDRRQVRAAQYTPAKNFTVLVGPVPDAERKFAVLHRLFPQATRQTVLAEQSSYTVTVVSVTESDVHALQRFLLSEAALTDDSRSHTARNCVQDIDAAVFVPQDGWYEFGWEDPYRPESSQVAGKPLSRVERLPLTTGFHPLHARLVGPCNGRPRLTRKNERAAQAVTVPLWASWLATDSFVAGAPMRVYPGYRKQGEFGDRWGEVLDIGETSQGTVVTLLRAEGRYWIRDQDADGRILAERELLLSPDAVVSGFVVAPAGDQIFVHTEQGALVANREGQVIARWGPESSPLLANVVWWSDGSLVVPIPGAGELQRLTPDGKVLEVVRTFQRGGGKFTQPVALAYDAPRKRLAVAENDGRILVLRVQIAYQLQGLAFDAELRPPFSTWPLVVRAMTFDQEGRLWVADPLEPRVFIYDGEGRRLMAERPENDWEAQLSGSGVVRRLLPRPDDVLAAVGVTAYRFRDVSESGMKLSEVGE